MDRSDSMGQRQCWVCYVTEAEEPTESFLRPCRCRGSTKWVHKACLQSWIDEKQKGDTMQSVDCPQCNTKYIIIYPSMGLVGRMLSVLDRVAAVASPLIVTSGVLVSVYWTMTSYGALVLCVVMGAQESVDFFERIDGKVAAAGLPTIPVALLASKRVHWQEPVLRFLNRFVFPRVRSNWSRSPVFGPLSSDSAPVAGPSASGGSDSIDGPAPAPTGDNSMLIVTANADPPVVPPDQLQPNDQQADVMVNIDLVIDRKSFLRSVASSLTLPFFARLTGELLYPQVRGTLKRTVFGGLTFLVCKGVVEIYYKRQQMVRQALRDIQNFPEEADASSQTERFETTSDSGSSEATFEVHVSAEL